MKILLLGKEGQVGGELECLLAGLGELIAWGRGDLDLAHAGEIRAKLHCLRADVIVNAAAYTAVDKAESEPELAMMVNGVAPGILAEEAQRMGALLVHYSTDYVFDGTKREPYTEQDVPHPLNVYGRSKLAGEQAVAAHASRFLIFRTEWVYGAHGRNFLSAIRQAGARRRELTIVDDQVGTPTWGRDIARATVQAIRSYLTYTGQERLSGIYHMTAQGQTSWFGLAQAAQAFGLFADMEHPPGLRAIPSAEYPTPARRPMYSVLSNAKLRDQFGIQLPDWKESLRDCLQGWRGNSVGQAGCP